ncbi:MAG: choice-of-anchor D domain-containing protein [Bacteroidota bacterium]
MPRLFSQRFAVLLWFIVCVVPAYSQLNPQIKEITPPTPNALKLTEYHASHPNMYTGTANVSIPLHTINFDGWSLPLTLSYNASGIRTNEEASEVGLGWSMSATGMISRTVNGGDDLYSSTTSGMLGYVYNEDSITHKFGYDWRTQEMPPAQSYYTKLVTKNPDTEPDIFNYNFFGFSGSFVLTQKVASGGVVKIKKITQDATAISFDEPSKTFTIITPTGYKGEFTVKELSTTLSSRIDEVFYKRELCCNENNTDIVAYYSAGGSLNHRYRNITSWYLSKITSPRGRTINFTYDNTNNVSLSRAFAEWPSITARNVCIQTVHEHKYLTGIFSDEVQITFAMDYRDDIRPNTLYTWFQQPPFPPGGKLKRYTGITITGLLPNSGLNKTITFTQNYFNQQFHHRDSNYDENNFLYLRSRLDEVLIDDQQYRFTYYNISKLPSKLTTAVDHFGFYNGVNEDTLMLPPDPVGAGFVTDSPNVTDTANLIETYQQKFARRVDFNAGVAGLLRKVKYPTRGYSLFEYEAHIYMPDQTSHFKEALGTGIWGQGNLAGGARIKTIKEYDYSNKKILTRTYKYVDDPDVSQSPTTGKLMTPLYNRYAQILYDHASQQPYLVRFKRKTLASIPGNSSAEGKVIGYSKVHEIVSGGGESYHNIYYFENRPNKVLGFNTIAVGYPDLNGQAMEVRNLDKDNKVVQQTVNSNYYHVLNDSIRGVIYETSGFPYLEFYVPYRLTRLFRAPYMTMTTTASSPSTISNTTTLTLPPGSATTTIQEIDFNKQYLPRTQRTYTSEGDTLETETKRPFDYEFKSTTLQYMLSPAVNLVDMPVENISRQNKKVFAANMNLFTQQGSLVNLTSTFSFNRKFPFEGTSNGIAVPTSYEKKGDITYNSEGQVIQTLVSDGSVNAVVWDPITHLPLVMGTGITQSQLQSIHNANVGNPNYNSLIRTAAGTAALTTYKHKPLVGVETVTDPANINTSFEYDAFSRLVKKKDKDNNTIEQYAYHFRELPDTRDLSVSGLNGSGVLDFGTIYNCDQVNPRILTFANTGEQPLYIYAISPPAGFNISWTGGWLFPETSVDAIVTFVGASSGTYTGNFSINAPGKTSGPSTIPVNAVFVAPTGNRIIELSKASVGFEDNMYHQWKTVYIKNTGTDCLKILDVTVPSNGEWAAILQTATLIPGASTQVQIMRLSGTNTVAQDVTIISNKSSGNNIIKVGPITKTLAIAPASLTLDPFGGTSTAQNITLTNTGNTDISVTNITSNMSTYFSVTPTNFVIPSNNGTKTVAVTYNTTDFTTRTTTLTYTSDKLSGPSTSTVTGTRRSDRIISISPNPLVLDYTGAHNNITVQNIGNDNLSVTGISYSANGWTVDPVSSTLLAPNQSFSFMVTRTGPNPNAMDITVNSNATAGNNVVQVRGHTRKISISPSPLTFSGFPETSKTINVTVTNNGDQVLDITNVTSDNNHFTAAPKIFSVNPGGGTQVVAITYTATDFTTQTGTVSFANNSTEGSGNVGVTGTRLSVRPISITPANPVSFDYTGDHKNIVIQNLNGNDNLHITGISYTPNASYWTVDPVSATTLGPNQSMSFQVTRIGPDPLPPLDITVNSDKTTGNNLVQIRAHSKIIGISPNPISFTGFTGTSSTQNVTVSNSGDSPLTVFNATSNNAKFDATPKSFTLQPSTNQTVTVTYTPTDFSTQTGLITFDTDKTSGTNGLSVSGTRDPIRPIQLSPASPLYFSTTFQTQTVTITNVNGTDNLNVTGLSYTATSSWNVSTLNPVSIPPNGTASFTVQRMIAAAAPLDITVNSNKTTGNNVIQVRAYQRIISVSPASLTFSGFTGSSSSQTVTVSNTGDYPLSVSNASSNNSRFDATPKVFTLQPNTSQVVTVIYTPNDFNTQSGAITFVSDATSGTGTVSVSGTRTAVRNISISPGNPVYFNTTGEHQTITITNASSSNDVLQVSGLSYTATSNWNIAALSPVSLSPGSSTSFQATRVLGDPGPLDVTVNANMTSGNNVVQLRPYTRIMNLNPSSITMAAFSGTSQTATVTVSNTGTSTMSVSNATSTNSRFDAVPKTFTLAPNASQVVTITYTPTDFNSQSTQIAFSSDLTSGSNALTVTGQRTSLRTIQLTPAGPLSFTLTNTPQYVTVQNVGNDNLSVTGVSNPSPSTWSASIPTVTLAPNQTTTLTIVKTSYSSSSATFAIISDKNGGTETIVADPINKIMTLSPATFTYPSFTGSSIGQVVQVGNSGNSTITVPNVSINNSRFTVSPTSFTIAPGSSVNITVTYTPTDFSTQSATITLNGDQSNGIWITATGTRTQSSSASVSPTSLVIKPWMTPGYSYLTNTGNVDVTVSSGSNSAPSIFTVEFLALSGGIWAPVSFPKTLSAGQQIQIKVSYKANGSGTVNMSTSLGVKSVTLTGATM